MKTEEIIKVLLLLGIIYLLFNCVLTENFADEIPRIRIALMSEGKAYRLVSFFDLKEEYETLVLQELFNQYKIESENNNKISDVTKRTSNSFLLFGGKEDALISALVGDSLDKIKENLKKLQRKDISKIPVIIISNDKVSDYTSSVSDFNTPTEKDKGLSMESGKYLYWNSTHNLLFSSGNESLKYEIKGLHTNTDKNKFEIEPIKPNDKDITPNKLAEKIIKNGDKSFTHYILSNTEGKDFSWKWYTDDLSKIQ